MSDQADVGTAVGNALAELVGLQILATNDVCGVRCFHFGEWHVHEDGERASFGLQIHCAWRIEDNDRIVTGSGDCFSRTDGNEDPSWEPGDPGGHLLEERLRGLFGSYEPGNDLCENQTASLRVLSIDAERFGGFRMQLSGGYTLVVFPRGSKVEEWALIRAAGEAQFVIEGGKVAS